MGSDERAYRLFGESMRTVNGNGAVIRLKTGGVTYYLQTYVDGTFDVHALQYGTVIAIAGVGTDGAIAGANARTVLCSRRDKFERDNGDEIVKDMIREQREQRRDIGR